MYQDAILPACGYSSTVFTCCLEHTPLHAVFRTPLCSGGDARPPTLLCRMVPLAPSLLVVVLRHLLWVWTQCGAPVAALCRPTETMEHCAMSSVSQSIVTFRNPLMPQGPDPWLVYHAGYYYLSATSSTEIKLRRAASITQLASATDITVWQDATPSRAHQVWAPEFYLLDSPHGPRWYLYYTASDSNDPMHRLHVLESQTTDPLGPYVYKAQLLTDPQDALYAIDAGILQTNTGALYLLWAGHPGHVLFISRMADPWTLCGDRVHLPAHGSDAMRCGKGRSHCDATARSSWSTPRVTPASRTISWAC